MMSNIYRRVNDKMIIGRSLLVLALDRTGRYLLTNLEIYQDRKIICWGIHDRLLWERVGITTFPEMSLDQFIEIVSLGKFVSIIPEGASITVEDLATFTVSRVESFLEQDDLIGVVKDTLHELNGEPTSSDRCREAFFRFLDEPTPLHHERLREAYQAVPSHWQIGVLKDSDNGDAAIMAILVREVDAIDRGGLDEQKQWYEHLRHRHEERLWQRD